MPISTTAPAFVTQLRTQLQARSGLTGVRVDIVQTGDISATESIVLIWGRIPSELKRFAMGRHSDKGEIPGMIQAFAADPDSDVAFSTAMTRAAAILDEIEFELRDNPPQVGNYTFDAFITDTGIQPFIHPDGGWYARLDYTLTYEAVVN